MVTIAFENYDNVSKPLRKLAMSRFSGEMVHCELISSLKNARMSAWWPEGVAIKDQVFYNENYEVFRIGEYDFEVFEYFNIHEGKSYNLEGLIWSMLFNKRSSGKKHFCSQICYDALIYAGVNLPQNRTETLSPQEFYFIIKSNFSQLHN